MGEKCLTGFPAEKKEGGVIAKDLVFKDVFPNVLKDIFPDELPKNFILEKFFSTVERGKSSVNKYFDFERKDSTLNAT